jgi:uncharacterized membrane protein
MNAPVDKFASIEALLGRALTVAVLASAAIAITGAILYLRPHGHDPMDFTTYEPQPLPLRSPSAIIAGAAHLDPASLMQLGALLLIATPAARVVFSLTLFVLRRDPMYVVITLAVLAALLAGLLGGIA